MPRDRATHNNVLFMFDAIINVDFGLLKLVKEEYNNPKFMMTNILANDDLSFRLMLLTSIDPNPLKIVLNDDSMDLADSLYSKFMNEEYSKILNYSERNSVYDILSVYDTMSEGAISTTILCTNEQQKQYISKFNHNLIVELSKIEEFDITEYDAIFVKDIRDLSSFNKLEGKNLYILNYRSNFEDDEWTIPLKSMIAEYGASNIFNITDVYADLVKPVG